VWTDSEEDCDGESVGSDAEQRLADSAPTHREEEDEWEECHITLDPREAEGIRKKQAGLRQALDPEADPILTLFLRFFPLGTYMDHLADVAGQWALGATSRHIIPWN
jgi:hypothetical protein